MTETKALVPMLIAPQTFGEWMELATTMAKSALVPKDFRDRPADVLVAMQMGVSVGLNPFQAVQSIAVINGRPCMWGDAVLGIVMNSEVYEDVDETFDEATMTATCTAQRKGRKKPTVRTFSLEEAKAAKVWSDGKMIALADKPGPWQGYKKRMLQMRARAWALRDTFPDVLKGLAVREEVEDYDNEPRRIGGQTIEERLADMMPQEVVPPGNQPEPQMTVVPADPTGASAQELGSPASLVSIVCGHSENDNYQPMTDTEVSDTPSTEAPAVETIGQPKLKFSIGKQNFETNGVTRKQMIRLFDLCPKVGKKLAAPDAPKKLLLREFKLEHRADLTEEQAERYLIRLAEILES